MAETITLSGQINALATAVGTEIKGVKTRVSTLETTVGNASTGLVKQVNDLQASFNSSTEINDSAVATTSTYSSSKIASEINAAKQAVKDDLLGGAGEAYDTLKELADLIGENADAITALETVAGNHVKYNEAQSLTAEQQAQARSNIGAASATDLSTLSGTVSSLSDAVGTTSTDFVATFNTALNATA